MRFGLLCSAQARSDASSAPPGQGLRDWLEFNEEAERLGFYSTFLVEHHFTGWEQVSATLTMLACLAMRTTTLRLGSGVLALPWHNPVLLAEQAATVDLVSGGRLDLGIGKGYRHAEFVGFCIAPEEGQRRFEEAVEVMTRGWTSGRRFSHAGTYWHFEDIVVEPKPAQSPHPPLWMAAGSDSSIARAAAAGYNLILDQYASPAQIADRIATYRDHLAAHPFDPMNVAVARYLYIADTEAETAAARGRLAAGTNRIIGVARDPSRPRRGSHVLAYQNPDAADAHALYGTPDQIAEGLAALQEAGVAYVLLIFETDVAQLRRFRYDVIPRLSQRGALDVSA
ncbi:MAG TPA: LLM class flavin-dependent oxidoreductase [Solirubrobacteraceae bacterium]|nr:LLM class flavin-dependent oxidoreductase [Solirubrobacteraceae bacterium]